MDVPDPGSLDTHSLTTVEVLPRKPEQSLQGLGAVQDGSDVAEARPVLIAPLATTASVLHLDVKFTRMRRQGIY